MNLFVEYMSFDPSWFATKEGIFITGGLVLLLIGLIGFILTGKKEKNEEVEKSAEAKTEEAPVVANDNPTPEAAPVVVPQGEEKVDNVVTTTEVVNQPVVETVEDTTPVAEPVSEVVVPVVETVEVINPVENNEVVETPVEQVVVEEPVVSANVAPVEPEVVVPAVEATPVQESTVSIYGGVSPQVNLAPSVEPKKVYGGADPLENTGALPRVEVPVEPVVAPVEVVTPVETLTPEVIAPAEETLAEPVVETLTTASPVAPSGDIETLEF